MEVASRHVYVYFWIFGMLNNVLYVVILSAAADIVGPNLPKSLVLLADILPSFVIKLLAPFFIHKLGYGKRVASLIIVSSFGMLLVSSGKLSVCLVGIVLASLSSGFGEITFLQLTHYYGRIALNGWSSGTGGAGLFGSGIYMLFTSIMKISVKASLFFFTLLPFGFLLYYKLGSKGKVVEDPVSTTPFLNHDESSIEREVDIVFEDTSIYAANITKKDDALALKSHIIITFGKLKELILPFMLPLTTVYLFEYLINQAVAPTLLFPLSQKNMPFFFHKYRDMYVTYGAVYQLGVFISRSTAHLVRLKRLYLSSMLQGLNLLLSLLQSWCYVISSPWPVLLLVFYEGFLGGASYVNTFLNILEDVEPEKREFALGSVSIADSFGVLIAALIGLALEPTLCNHQVANGRPWCTMQ